jgi:hypothetical protein
MPILNTTYNWVSTTIDPTDLYHVSFADEQRINYVVNEVRKAIIKERAKNSRMWIHIEPPPRAEAIEIFDLGSFYLYEFVKTGYQL